MNSFVLHWDNLPHIMWQHSCFCYKRSPHVQLTCFLFLDWKIGTGLESVTTSPGLHRVAVVTWRNARKMEWRIPRPPHCSVVLRDSCLLTFNLLAPSHLPLFSLALFLSRSPIPPIADSCEMSAHPNRMGATVMIWEYLSHAQHLSGSVSLTHTGSCVQERGGFPCSLWEYNDIASGSCEEGDAGFYTLMKLTQKSLTGCVGMTQTHVACDT